MREGSGGEIRGGGRGGEGGGGGMLLGYTEKTMFPFPFTLNGI